MCLFICPYISCEHVKAFVLELMGELERLTEALVGLMYHSISLRDRRSRTFKMY